MNRPMLFALALAGCAGATGTAPSPGKVVEVAATDGFAFTPRHLTVPLGTTVRWTNKWAVPHTVTSGGSSRPGDSPGTLLDRPLASGAAVEMTFTTAGDCAVLLPLPRGDGNDRAGDDHADGRRIRRRLGVGNRNPGQPLGRPAAAGGTSRRVVATAEVTDVVSSNPS
jgi:plastocyanin